MNLRRNNPGDRLSECLRESLEQPQLLGMIEHLIFRVPLNSDDESTVRSLQGFYSAVIAIPGRNAQPRSDFCCSLVVPRIHLPTGCACNLRQQRAGLDDYFVRRHCGLSALRIVPVRHRKMLDQRSTVVDIQDLQASTDAEDGQIAFDRLVDEL